MRKLKIKDLLQKRIFTLPEQEESLEKFKSWWDPHLPNCYFAMHNRHRTTYRKGDQLFNSYGVRNNRHLIVNYGFCMARNSYNSLGFKVFVTTTSAEDASKTHKHVKILRLKKDRVSEPLLQYLRANLINSFKADLKKLDSSIAQMRCDRLLVSAPVDLDFEIQIL